MTGHWLTSLTKQGRYAFMEFIMFYTLSRQIKAMRLGRGWTQLQFAERMGCTQSWVSQLETYRGIKGVTITTLCRVAAAFDVALSVQFCMWSEWVNIYISPTGYSCAGLCAEALAVKTFAKDLEFIGVEPMSKPTSTGKADKE